MDNRKFIKLSVELVRRYGAHEAILYAFLVNAAQVWKKDKRGYMEIQLQYLSKELGLSKNTVRRAIERLKKNKLIDYKFGKNQNSQPKLKVL